MAHDIKLTSGEGDMKARLDKRLRNSGEGADVTVKHGEGARRTFHNIHRGSSQHGQRNANAMRGDLQQDAPMPKGGKGNR